MLTLDQYYVYQILKRFTPTTKLNRDFPASRIAAIVSAATEELITVKDVVVAARFAKLRIWPVEGGRDAWLGVRSSDVRKAMVEAGVGVDLIDASIR
jgi:hypothetical protein